MGSFYGRWIDVNLFWIVRDTRRVLLLNEVKTEGFSKDLTQKLTKFDFFCEIFSLCGPCLVVELESIEFTWFWRISSFENWWKIPKSHLRLEEKTPNNVSTSKNLPKNLHIQNQFSEIQFLKIFQLSEWNFKDFEKGILRINTSKKKIEKYSNKFYACKGILKKAFRVFENDEVKNLVKENVLNGIFALLRYFGIGVWTGGEADTWAI